MMAEPFGLPPKEYSYRCSECKTEILVNEAVIDAEIGMARFRVREKITLHSCISFSGHFCPIFNRRILYVAQATLAVQLI